MTRSNPSESAGRYHHGDLASTLIATALEIVAEDGIDALSLRALARRAGVSHAAPYHHFKTKGELLHAIAEQGFARLSRNLEEAAAKAAPGDELVELGCAYVAFAAANPAFFRVMFRPDLTGASDETHHPGAAAFAQLRNVVARLVAGQGRAKDNEVPRDLASVGSSGDGGAATSIVSDAVPRPDAASAAASNGDAALPSLAAWALVHGIASLWVDGPLPALTGGARSPEDLTRQIALSVREVLRGGRR